MKKINATKVFMRPRHQPWQRLWLGIRLCAFAGIFFISSTTCALNAQEIYEKVSPSIYTLYGINSETHRPKVLGSAVAINKQVLATNCHVALGGDYLVLKIHKEYRYATTIYTNRERDLCLVVVPGTDFTPVDVRPSNSVNIGEDVLTVGNPAGIERTLSKGIISNKHYLQKNVLLQTDAAVSTGSSGGGLFDINGKLIGIITLRLRETSGIALAIPTEWLMKGLSMDDTQKQLAELTKESSKSAEVKPKPSNILKANDF